MMRKSPGLLRGTRRFAIGVALFLVLTACTGETPEPAEKDPFPSVNIVPASSLDTASGGTLKLGAGDFPDTFNTFHVDGAGSTAAQILEPTRGSAVRIEWDGSWSVNHDYARSVQIVDRSPLTVQVDLEPKAMWQDGSAITSRDMVQFVKAMKDELFLAAPHPAMADIKKVKVESKTSYRVVFSRANADWPAVIYPSLPAAATESAEVFNTELSDKAPSANGPFQVAKISRKTGTVRLKRNPRWWGRTPALEEIVWRFAKPSVLAEAFELGSLDAVPVTAENHTAVTDSERIRVSASTGWSQVTLNGGRGPLSKAKVRRAISLALDREAFAKDLEGQLGYAGKPLDTSILVPGQVGHQEVGTEQDLSQAKDLLAEAGWKQSEAGAAVRKKKKLVLTMPVPVGQDSQARRARMVASQLAKIGVEVNVESVDADTFFSDRVIPLDFDLVTFSRWGSPFNVSTARSWFTPIDGPENFTGKTSKAITKAFKRANTELDKKKLPGEIAAVEDVATAQASILPLAVFPKVIAIADGVVNYGPTQFEDLNWTRVGWHVDSKQG